MSKKITTEKEYQRRKKLLDKHKREDTDSIRYFMIRQAIPKADVLVGVLNEIKSD